VYRHEVTGAPISGLFEEDASEFTRTLAMAVCDRSEQIDTVIARYSRDWTIDRIAPLEKAILRVAILELTDPGAAGGATPIPPEGAIDEAVETAKQFCGAQAPAFVNGILGAVIDEGRKP
jgi:N utilization substance protein B